MPNIQKGKKNKCFNIMQIFKRNTYKLILAKKCKLYPEYLYPAGNYIFKLTIGTLEQGVKCVES